MPLGEGMGEGLSAPPLNAPRCVTKILLKDRCHVVSPLQEERPQAAGQVLIQL